MAKTKTTTAVLTVEMAERWWALAEHGDGMDTNLPWTPAAPSSNPPDAGTALMTIFFHEGEFRGSMPCDCGHCVQAIQKVLIDIRDIGARGADGERMVAWFQEEESRTGAPVLVWAPTQGGSGYMHPIYLRMVKKIERSKSLA